MDEEIEYNEDFDYGEDYEDDEDDCGDYGVDTVGIYCENCGTFIEADIPSFFEDYFIVECSCGNEIECTDAGIFDHDAYDDDEGCEDE